MTSPDAFSPVATARRLLREARTAALATLARRTGHPFGSMVSIACDLDGTPILLMSTLAAHSRNLAEDPRASLLIEDRTVPDPQQGARITVVGRIEKLDAPDAAARRYLARLPEANLYAGFGDFAFFRLVVEDAHLVAGFGRAVRVRAEDLLLAPDLVEAFRPHEVELAETLARDLPRLARLAAASGLEPRDWRLVGLDPEGLDLAADYDESRMYRRVALQSPARSRPEFEAFLRTREESEPLQ